MSIVGKDFSGKGANVDFFRLLIDVKIAESNFDFRFVPNLLVSLQNTHCIIETLIDSFFFSVENGMYAKFIFYEEEVGVQQFAGTIVF
jgi:hypothetical protein